MIRTLPVLLILLTGCSETAPSDGLITPNPATEHCLREGGRLEYTHRAAGFTGYCLLPDGGRIEEWRLYLRDAILPAPGSELQ